MSLVVNVGCDEEGIWYVLSSDIPGLHVEAETLEELVDNLPA
jgi:predicted RNase H-like HicB family nuclease